MKSRILAAIALLFAAALGGSSLIAGCSSGMATTVCTDAGIDATPTCVTSVSGSGGW